MIGTYLPQALGEDETNQLIDEVIQEMAGVTIKDMGQIIGAVKTRSAGSADGSLVARLVKARLDKL